MKILLLLVVVLFGAIGVSAASRRTISTASTRKTASRTPLLQQSFMAARPTSRAKTLLQDHGSFSKSRRRRTPTSSSSSSSPYSCSQDTVQLCSASGGAGSVSGVGERSIPATLLRGALLRIASDFSGGTVFESVKTRVATTQDNAIEAIRNICKNGGGIGALWTGSSSRTVEGALIGSVFMLASAITKSQIRALGGGPTAAALGAGFVGGIAQSLVMTPAGMVFTSLNVNRGKFGHEKENAWTVTQKILKEKGPIGLYAGFKPMAIRQATNWASRAGFTEVARSVFGLQRYGILGEIGSGVLGGLGSCWNTPIETIRVITQRDLSIGLPTKTISGYWNEIVERDGYPGLFRGVTPRAFQAIWQTCFMVVVPNIMGI